MIILPKMALLARVVIAGAVLLNFGVNELKEHRNWAASISSLATKMSSHSCWGLPSTAMCMSQTDNEKETLKGMKMQQQEMEIQLKWHNNLFTVQYFVLSFKYFAQVKVVTFSWRRWRVTQRHIVDHFDINGNEQAIWH